MPGTRLTAEERKAWADRFYGWDNAYDGHWYNHAHDCREPAMGTLKQRLDILAARLGTRGAFPRPTGTTKAGKAAAESCRIA